MELHERVREFTKQTVAAMGVPLDVTVVDAGDNIRVELSGEGGELLLRRRAEALDALQQIVNTAFRRELKDDRSFVVDCMDYRKAKDAELRQMARFMMEKAKTAGPQEMGPLNPYARRQHMSHLRLLNEVGQLLVWVSLQDLVSGDRQAPLLSKLYQQHRIVLFRDVNRSPRINQRKQGHLLTLLLQLVGHFKCDDAPH